MTNRIISTLALSLLLFGCASTQRMNNVSLGMTKSEVIDVMGNPDVSKCADGVEYLIYALN